MNKVVTPLLLSLMMVLTISCEKKPEEEETIELYGEWEYVSAKLETYKANVLINTATVEQDWYMVQFNQDGYFVVYFDRNDNTDTEVMNWSRSGDVVIIDGEQYNIDSLTKDKLVFSYWGSVTEKYIFTCRRI